MNRIKTTKIGGNVDYAKVADRLVEFRSKNPRASINTLPSPMNDGGMMFQTTIIADKSDPYSAEATGTAFYTANELKKPKSFEKLETISVGRALALLGYVNNGEIATTEEMEEFENYREIKRQEEIEQAINSINSCKTIDELKKVFFSLNNVNKDPKVYKAKENKKQELTNESN